MSDRNPKKRQGFAGESLFVVPRGILRRAVTHPLLLGFYITDAGRFPKARHHFRRRAGGAEEHILMICEAGHGTVTVDQHNEELSPGTMLFLPANVPHEYDANQQDPWTLSWCHFRGTEARRYFAHLPPDEGPYEVPARELALADQLFRLLFDVLSRGYSVEHLISAACLGKAILGTLCFDNVAVHHRIEQRWRPAVERAVSYIQKNLDRPIRLEQLAEAAGLSISRLSALFSEATGDSPMAFASKMRIERACHYLESTEATAAEVAYRVGYDDPLYFSRVFKKNVGCSPRVYRNQRSRGRRSRQ